MPRATSMNTTLSLCIRKYQARLELTVPVSSRRPSCQEDLLSAQLVFLCVATNPLIGCWSGVECALATFGRAGSSGWVVPRARAMWVSATWARMRAARMQVRSSLHFAKPRNYARFQLQPTTSYNHLCLASDS